MLVYAATIFLSAFLLFQVQPLIAKFILPWFGGSAAVWSAALLFFQLMLLAGYLYAHCLIRYLKAKQQFVGACGAAGGEPGDAADHSRGALETDRRRGDPTLRSCCCWARPSGCRTCCFRPPARCCRPGMCGRIAGAIPYRLFALSNFGSMLALLSYPVLVEPRLALGASGGRVVARIRGVRGAVRRGRMAEPRWRRSDANADRRLTNAPAPDSRLCCCGSDWRPARRRCCWPSPAI